MNNISLSRKINDGLILDNQSLVSLNLPNTFTDISSKIQQGFRVSFIDLINHTIPVLKCQIPDEVNLRYSKDQLLNSRVLKSAKNLNKYCVTQSIGKSLIISMCKDIVPSDAAYDLMLNGIHFVNANKYPRMPRVLILSNAKIWRVTLS